MQAVILPDGVDVSPLFSVAGAMAYGRGAGLARQRAVLHMEWDGDTAELRGIVRGSTGVYQAWAHFDEDAAGRAAYCCGQCSCPAEDNCKHVVALVLTAARRTGTKLHTTGLPELPAWEETMRQLVSAGPAELAAEQGVPLAVQLSLTGGPEGRKLSAKLVYPGKTGWVSGGLTWTALASPYLLSGHPPEQVRLLKELWAINQARNGRQYYFYDEKTINLASFESPSLWSLLDRLAAGGVQLVHARKAMGPVEPYRHGELVLDITRREGSGPLVVRPVLRLVDGDRVVDPILFVGIQAHGVVFAEPGEATSRDLTGLPIRLARLASPVPVQLQNLACKSGHIEVPASEVHRFDQNFYPRLRHLAPVVSSDGSYVPPDISGPTLVLRAEYGEGHDLELDWDWVYQVGDTTLRVPVGPAARPDTPYRDPAAEADVLDNLPVPLDELGLSPGGASGRRKTGGLDTMRITTELLPLLGDLPGVAVEISGEPADYREVGDSVVVGVSTAASDDPDWFDLDVALRLEGRAVPLPMVIAAMARDLPYLLLPDGAYFSLDKPELRTLRRLVDEARALQDRPGPLRISRYQAGLWEELAALGVVDRQARAWRDQIDGLLSIGSLDPVPVPAGLAAVLRPYQHEGFAWLAFLWQHQLGGILADDMGLGKTIQALTLICHARETAPDSPPFLIVAPTSVVPNWAAEAARFAPGLRIATLTATSSRRSARLTAAISGADVVVTSYAVFRIDADDFAAADWSGLLLDEAQHVKNHQSKTHQAARRLPVPFKLAITGTPMENNLMELWSLLSITAPGLFPSPARFKDYYARPIEKQHDSALLGQLRRRIRPLVTRRTKEQVADDLPTKQEQVLDVDLHPKHRAVYDRHLARERQKVLGLIDDMDKNRFTILRSLTLLRQLSLHAGLVDEAYAKLPSAKIDLLLDQLREVAASGHRALVFSQFTRYLSIVRDRLAAAGLEFCYLDGSTRNRHDVLSGFKDGTAPVFLISLKAGGFGLNLTEADYCFLLDPWWNPATEAQAIDRTHRIGQTRNVMVYRLIARDTIEDKVMALKARKAELFAGVLDDGNVFGTTMTADDVRGLFS